MEIQFSTGTPASNIYGGTAGKYRSGIISTTGLNARTENLVVRDFEATWPYSGVIYNTGLNAVIGNNMEIQFSTSSPAAAKYGGTEGKYKSGIISTTGLNVRTENLIVRDFETSWPYSGVIYNTGLNALQGNLVEIQFKANTDAANTLGLNSRVEGKYKSGIISITGLNIIQTTGNLITNHIQSTWPYKNVIHTTGLNVVSNDDIGHIIDNDFPRKYSLLNINRSKKSTELLTLTNTVTGSLPNINNITDSGLLLDYSKFFVSKPNQTIELICENKILYGSSVIFYIPEVPDLGSSNYIKETELATALSTSATLSIQLCTDLGASCYNTSSSITDPAGGSASDWEPTSLTIVSGTFTLEISLIGGKTSPPLHLFNTYSHQLTNKTITTNANAGVFSKFGGTYTASNNDIFDPYRSDLDQSRSTLNNIDPITAEHFRNILINSDTLSTQNYVAPLYKTSNVGYQRSYRKLLGYNRACSYGGNCITTTAVYRTYTTPTFYGTTAIDIVKRYFKTTYSEE
jgi:hypothetical protein